jgi:hypothetical protein
MKIMHPRMTDDCFVVARSDMSSTASSLARKVSYAVIV